eukprot:CAMPEP_0175288878 /NCGR_PEP_ID=MMETSP0093-20121207/55040_1 /TAXON_ID=311494 /ORGANISM="Alexandrium monilatum, Strain CCMP3105" /LENGTH=128 /DNA_ID=CAMNT_0016584457 /DNA_START=280 /DNA_END=667 /DNA_ORIENTATION=-
MTNPWSGALENQAQQAGKHLTTSPRLHQQDGAGLANAASTRDASADICGNILEQLQRLDHILGGESTCPSSCHNTCFGVHDAGAAVNLVCPSWRLPDRITEHVLEAIACVPDGTTADLRVAEHEAVMV